MHCVIAWCYWEWLECLSFRFDVLLSFTISFNKKKEVSYKILKWFVVYFQLLHMLFAQFYKSCSVPFFVIYLFFLNQVISTTLPKLPFPSILCRMKSSMVNLDWWSFLGTAYRGSSSLSASVTILPTSVGASHETPCMSAGRGWSEN